MPWAAILLIVLVTFFNRIAGPVMMRYIKPSPQVDRFLEAMSVSIVAALVASILIQEGWREAAAVSVAMLVMLRVQSAVIPILAGVGTAAAWSVLVA